MQQGLLDVINESQRLGLSDHGRLVRNWAQELASKADTNGDIPGQAYKAWHSRLGKMMASGGDQAMWLGALRDAAEGGMDRSISAGDRQAWSAVRKQYAALKTVEPLVAKSVKGDISPAGLMDRVTSDGAGKVRMANDRGGLLGDLARVGQGFLKEAPNSGTADRLLVNAGLLGGVGFAQHKDWIDPAQAGLLTAALAGNRVGLKAINSRALAMGESRALQGLARVAKPAPRLLPALLMRAKGGLLAPDPQDDPLRGIRGH